MNKLMKYGWLILAVAVLGACSITPSTIVQQPMSARAQAAATPAKSGAIFNQAAYRPLFEDRRPRYVGDTVTVTIAENTSARKSGGSSASKDGEVDGSIASFLGKAIPRATFSAS
jgi:flagellar L-ring protein FlgH